MLKHVLEYKLLLIANHILYSLPLSDVPICKLLHDVTLLAPA